MNIFITGIAGFLGSNLAHYLVGRNHKVFGNDNFWLCSLVAIVSVSLLDLAIIRWQNYELLEINEVKKLIL